MEVFEQLLQLQAVDDWEFNTQSNQHGTRWWDKLSGGKSVS